MGKVILPSAEEIMAALRGVYDDPHAVKGLYPGICEHAGQPKEPSGIELMLLLAIHDYTADLPASVETAMSMFVPNFLVALIAASAGAS